MQERHNLYFAHPSVNTNTTRQWLPAQIISDVPCQIETKCVGAVSRNQNTIYQPPLQTNYPKRPPETFPWSTPLATTNCRVSVPGPKHSSRRARERSRIWWGNSSRLNQETASHTRIPWISLKHQSSHYCKGWLRLMPTSSFSDKWCSMTNLKWTCIILSRIRRRHWRRKHRG